MTLTEFLLARIAEDEAEASHKHDLAYHDMHYGDCGCEYPARVLAECEAKRSIVEACAKIQAVSGWEYEDAPNLADDVLADLATVYSDHPDYRDEWKP